MPEIYKHSGRVYERPWGYNRSIIYLAKDKSIEFIEIKMECGQASKHHYHRMVTEYFYILSGSARFIIDDTEYNVSEGDFIVVKPMEKHKIVAGSNGVVILAVKIPGSEEDRIFV